MLKNDVYHSSVHACIYFVFFAILFEGLMLDLIPHPSMT